MRKKELYAFFEENADPKYREFNGRLVPGHGKMYGVRVPVLRKKGREICKGDWRSFLEIGSECYEHTVLRAIVIASADMSGEERLSLTEGFLPEIDNWACCDLFCGDWRIDSEETRGRLWDYCLGLIETGEGFPMRVCAVMMLAHFVDDGHIDGILGTLTSHDSPERPYRMGAAWALSVCYVRYPEKTEEAAFSGSLPLETLRMTVGKIRDSYRVPAEDKARLKARLGSLS